MKIAQVAPLAEAVPPKLYGGTERIVSYLTEELVAQGHEVSLFASGDSITTANLVPLWPQALRLDPAITDYLAPTMIMLEKFAQRAEEFDVVHLHIDYLSYSLMKRLDVPSVTTLHGRLDLPELQSVYRTFGEVPVVSISNSQRQPLPHANYVETIYHGLPEKLLTPRYTEGGYLAFLGRISPEKAPDAAIRIAAAAGMRIKIAAKVDKADLDYFNEKIKPLVSMPHVDWIGEINEQQKSEFLNNAAALLFPICWREPFGLVMIESMACGTPVIAFNNGSVPEVLEEGVSGFICRTEEEAAAAVGKLKTLDRYRIRQAFENRFTARRMAENYVDLYRRIAKERQAQLRAVG